MARRHAKSDGKSLRLADLWKTASTAVAVGLLLAAVAAAVPHGGSQESQASQPASVSQGQTPASANSSVQQKIDAIVNSLGSRPQQSARPIASEFHLTDLNGKPLDLRKYGGHVVILDFWATWCAPCREEIPELVGLQTRYESQGLRVIGIAVGDRRSAVEKFYRNYLMNYPVAMGTSEVRQAYGGATSLPSTFLIGRDGRIYASFVGAPADSDYGRLEESVRVLLNPSGSSGGSVMEAGQTPPPSPEAASPQARTVASVSSQAPSSSSTAAASSSRPSPPRQSPTQRTPVIAPKAARPKPAAAPDLSDPSPDQIQRIIQAFAAREEMFKEARQNYTYHQINKVETLDADGNVNGEWEMDWDVLFDDQGNRIEHVTYAPVGDLKDLILTEQDMDAFRNIQPFVLTTDDLPNYEVKYVGHVKVDYITAYVFSVRPKEIEKGRQYFKGVIWVDDHDLQIVKAEGEQVPQIEKKNEQNLFPRFTTYRQQIDGKYWFPTFTLADDTLYFSGGPVHIREIIKYTDYKQFKSSIRILSVRPEDQPQQPPPKPY